MFGILALTEIAMTMALQLYADMGINPAEMTREQWVEINKVNIERRKGIMAKIRAH